MSLSRHSRAMLLNVLWHHQGGSSQVGQPIRTILGIEPYARLSEEEVSEAKWIDALLSESAVLRDQVAHLSLYKPARRTEQKVYPVKAIGPCNEPFWFKGIRETDEQFAERAGTEVDE